MFVKSASFQQLTETKSSAVDGVYHQARYKYPVRLEEIMTIDKYSSSSNACLGEGKEERGGMDGCLFL